MKKIRFRTVVPLATFALLVFFAFPAISSADKSSVTIEAPEKAQKGSEITIKLNVRHSGNNLFHYTDELKVSVNGKEVKRWEFSFSKRPEDAHFSREITYRVDEGLIEIVGEANCNMHGSAGPAKMIVDAR